MLSKSHSFRKTLNGFGSFKSGEPLFQQPKTLFGAGRLGSTHQAGFSFNSKSLPRNNSNFTKGVKEGRQARLSGSRSNSDQGVKMANNNRDKNISSLYESA